MHGGTHSSLFFARAAIFVLYALPVIGTILSTVLLVRLQWPWLLPLAQCLAFYPVFGYCLWNEWRTRAIILGLIWALTLTTSVIVLTAAGPEVTAPAILHGADYKAEMYEWIHTGIGTESQPLRFIPRHIVTIVVFVVASIPTGSFLSLLLGAVMMNYMSFYVGSLVHDTTVLIPPLFLGWHVWALIRVISFVILGVVLAEPLWAKIRGTSFSARGIQRYAILAGTGLLLDIVLKSFLAPLWATLLRAYLP